jgi:hypothetical protein
MLYKTIREVVVLVQVHVQWNQLKKGEQADVDFHSHCHHLKKKPK